MKTKVCLEYFIHGCRINVHCEKRQISNIYKQLHKNEEQFSSFNSECFSILDYAPTKYKFKSKEGMYID